MLETNNQDLALLENQKNFDLNLNNRMLENLSYIHSQDKKIQMTTLFTQLSPFFEVGFLFERQVKGQAKNYGVVKEEWGAHVRLS